MRTTTAAQLKAAAESHERIYLKNLDLINERDRYRDAVEEYKLLVRRLYNWPFGIGKRLVSHLTRPAK